MIIFIFFAVSVEILDKNFIRMETMMSEEEKAILKQVKGTFPCWQTRELKKKIMRNTNWRLVIGKYFLIVLLVLIASFVVGTFIQQTKHISIWWHKNVGKVDFLYFLIDIHVKQDKTC